MKTLPATYLELRATFILRRITFAQLARQLGTSTQFVRNTLMMYWGRTDLQPSGKLGQAIIAAVVDLLHETGGQTATGKNGYDVADEEHAQAGAPNSSAVL